VLTVSELLAFAMVSLSLLSAFDRFRIRCANRVARLSAFHEEESTGTWFQILKPRHPEFFRVEPSSRVVARGDGVISAGKHTRRVGAAAVAERPDAIGARPNEN
jgi:hypothetical protein